MLYSFRCWLNFSYETTYIYGHKIEYPSTYPLHANFATSVAVLTSPGSPQISDAFSIHKYTSKAEVCSRLNSHSSLYLGYLDGCVAHHSWVQYRGVHRIISAGVEYVVGDGEICIYHCFTRPYARGKSLYPLVLSHILSNYFAAGYTSAIIYTSKRNHSSQKGILKSGFLKVSTLKSLKIGKFYIPL